MLGERERLGIRAVVVAFAPAQSLARYQAGLGLGELLVLSDPDRRAYRAFGFERGSFARVWLDPRVWRRYAGLIVHGRRPARSREDTLQLGGDVLIDADGLVRWIYRSAGPEDRPTVEQVAAALAALRSS